MCWIAFNALYGRVNETSHGRYLRPGDEDARWFLRMICDLDGSPKRIESAVSMIRKDARALLKSRYLSEAYWRQGYSSFIKGRIEEETGSVEDALDSGDPYPYLTTLLWGRIRILRNQIFHGCSTNRDSLKRDTIDPALRVLNKLIPLFVNVMESRIDKENDWPDIPFPRHGSPKHPIFKSHYR